MLKTSPSTSTSTLTTATTSTPTSTTAPARVRQTITAPAARASFSAAGHTRAPSLTVLPAESTPQAAAEGRRSSPSIDESSVAVFDNPPTLSPEANPKPVPFRTDAEWRHFLFCASAGEAPEPLGEAHSIKVPSERADACGYIVLRENGALDLDIYHPETEANERCRFEPKECREIAAKMQCTVEQLPGRLQQLGNIEQIVDGYLGTLGVDYRVSVYRM